jgi:hypothetical protein
MDEFQAIRKWLNHLKHVSSFADFVPCGIAYIQHLASFGNM